MFKKGDTLIEVCIAIGIFSLIAIGVAAVMSSGTAGSQTALETTLAREEIDTQAEALRFIHDSYMSSNNYESNAYTEIWNKIKAQAINGKTAADNKITQFSPETCDSLYDKNNGLNNVYKQKGFIINVKEMDNPDNVLIRADNAATEKVFKPTTTYPRLIYNNTNNSNTLSYAEGLYVIAVRDSGTKMVVEGSTPTSTEAFYDFYIRSCWYGTDSERPTAISTVIRLYDPPAVKTTITQNSENYVRFIYHDSDTPPAGASIPPITYASTEIIAGQTGKIADPKTDPAFSRFKARFTRWRAKNGQTYEGGQLYSVPADFKGRLFIDLYAAWDSSPFTVTFKTSGGAKYASGVTSKTETCAAFTACEYDYEIPEYYFNASNFVSPDPKKLELAGWASTASAQRPQYEKDGNRKIGQLQAANTVLYAVWKPYYWVDVNVFKNYAYGGQTTGGYTGYTFDIYVNGYPRGLNVIDYYTPVADSNYIKVVFRKVSGWYISNLAQICNQLPNSGCKTSENSSSYTVEFTVVPDSIAKVIDSSGHYSIQIEPIWKPR